MRRLVALGRGAMDGRMPMISFASSYVITEGAMLMVSYALAVGGTVSSELLTTVEQANRCKLMQMLLVIYGYIVRP